MAKFEELRYVVKVDDQGTFVIDELNIKTKSVKNTFESLSKAILSTDALKKKMNATDRLSIKELKELRDTLIINRDAMSLTAAEYSKFTQRIDQVNVRINEFKTQAKGITKVNGDMQSSAGLAGAATIELGRVFSDAGFGIRGVANNIQQLASLFITLSVSAGGAGKAITLIVRQLKGPLGILVAFQALVSLIEYLDRTMNIFTSTASRLRDEFNKMAKEIDVNRIKLESYISVLEDSNSSEGARLNALKELKAVFPELFDKQGKLKTSTEELTLSVKQYVKNQQIRAKIDSLIAANSENIAKADRARRIQSLLESAKTEKERRKILQDNLGFFEAQAFMFGMSMEEAGDVGFLYKAIIGLPEENTKILESFNRQKEGLFNEINTIETEIERLQKQISIPKKVVDDDGDFEEMAKKARNEDIKNLSEYINERLRLMQDLYSQESKDELDAQLRKLEIAEDNEMIKASEIMDVDKYNQIKELIELKYEKLREDANQKHLDRLEKQRKKYNDRFSKLVDKQNQDYFDKYTKANNEELKKRAELQQQSIPNIRDFLEQERKEFNDFVGTIGDALQNVADIFYAGINEQREMQISQVDARTQSLLANEKLSQEQRVKILKDAEERKKEINEQAIKDELKLSKIRIGLQAIELAADIIKTTGVFANETTKASIKAAGTLNPVVIAGWAVTAAALAAQYAAAKKKSEAALAQLNSQAGGYGSSLGSGANVSVEAPSFNVVGQSQVSQLSESIAGALGEPVKAYVVSSDISDAMAFERKTKSGGMFGSSGL